MWYRHTCNSAFISNFQSFYIHSYRDWEILHPTYWIPFLKEANLFPHLSMKETENLIFFRWKIDFYFTHEQQKRYFHSWLRLSWKYRFWCSFDEIKIDLTPKKSNILYIVTHIKWTTLLNRVQSMDSCDKRYSVNTISGGWIINELREKGGGAVCLLLFVCGYVVSVWRGFLFLWVLWMGYVVLL